MSDEGYQSAAPPSDATFSITPHSSYWHQLRHPLETTGATPCAPRLRLHMGTTRSRFIKRRLLRADEQAIWSSSCTVVSDLDGDIAATRVVAATEAQFPDQRFVTVRHPRVETVADLFALTRMDDQRAVVIFTLVEPTLRSTMRELCEDRRRLLRPARSAARCGCEGLAGSAVGRDAAGGEAAARRAALGGSRNRVRGQERRRARTRVLGAADVVSRASRERPRRC